MNNAQPDCQTLQELAMLAADMPEALDAAEQALLESHLAACEACRSYQASLTTLIHSIRDMEPVPVPHGLADKIMAELHQPAKPAFKAVPLRKKYAPLAAAAVLLAITISMMLPDNNVPTQTVAQKTPDVIETRTPVQPAPEITAEQPTPVHVETPAAVTRQAEKPATVSKALIASKPVSATPIAGKKPATGMVRTYEPETPAAIQGELVAANVADAIVASESESDVYYDPLSDVVGF